jgi:hypothetical protein
VDRRYENTEIRKYGNTKIRKYENTKIRKYENTEIRKYGNTKIRKLTHTLSADDHKKRPPDVRYRIYNHSNYILTDEFDHLVIS